MANRILNLNVNNLVSGFFAAESAAATVAGGLIATSLVQPLFTLLRTEIICRPLFFWRWSNCTAQPQRQQQLEERLNLVKGDLARTFVNCLDMQKTALIDANNPPVSWLPPWELCMKKMEDYLPPECKDEEMWPIQQSACQMMTAAANGIGSSLSDGANYAYSYMTVKVGLTALKSMLISINRWVMGRIG